MRTTHPSTTKRDNFIALVTIITWLDIWSSYVRNCYLGKFTLKIHAFFSRSSTSLAIALECLVRLMRDERKWVGWILGIICDLDLWPHSWPWPWVFQGQISKWLYPRNCWPDWCEMKGKRFNRILGWLYDYALWPHSWPWPWSFKVWIWNSLISGMGRPVNMKRKGCESSIHDDDID